MLWLAVRALGVRDAEHARGACPMSGCVRGWIRDEGDRLLSWENRSWQSSWDGSADYADCADLRRLTRPFVQPASDLERDPQTHEIIGAAFEVHSALGPGHLEAVYQEALEIELELRGIPFVSQPRVHLQYKGRPLRKHYRPDFVVRERGVVEIKAQTALGDIDMAQAVNSLKCCRKRVGLLLNFGEPSLQYRRLANTVR